MRNNWTREDIIRHLVERQAKGLPLSVGGEGVDKTLYGAARRIFGSWRNAIQAAGIAPQHVLTWERWSPARILVMIRHLARRDRPLTTEQMERRYHNVVSAARRHFGSWTKAVLAAGVEPTKLQRVVPWSPERVIEAILTRALRGESLVARMVEPRSLVEAGQRFFGGWSAAVTAAGLDPASTLLPPRRNKRPRPGKPRTAGPKSVQAPRERWNRERVIAALHARLREQKPMHSQAIARDDHSLYRAMRRHLKNWSEAMRAAGLDPAAYRRGPSTPPAAPDFGSRGSVARQSHNGDGMRPERPT
jgi:hypothetical protein